MVMTGLMAMAATVLLGALRVPFAVALLLMAGAGLAALGGDAVRLSGDHLAALVRTPELPLVPLVLLLGNLGFYAGFATRVHDAAAVLLQGRRGGLALAALLGCAGFAANSGSSAGCTATMARIALPRMLAAGYDARLAGASVAMGSSLGALLPPSMLLVFWGLLAGVPVGVLFLAGLLPLLLSLVGVVAVALWWVARDPRAAPLPHPLAIPAGAALRAAWPAPLLFAILVVGLWSGLLSATAAISVCLVLTVLIGLLQHRLTPGMLRTALGDTLRQSLAAALLLVAGRLFLTLLDLTGMPLVLAGAAAEIMPPLLAFALFGLVCLGLALAVEPAPLLVLSLPFALALAGAYGLDGVWAGIVQIKLVAMALILPPLGLNVLVIGAAVRAVSPAVVFEGVLRFMFVDLLVLSALILFPALTDLAG